jgi:FAD/FMN-containing dehydrogenase
VRDHVTQASGGDGNPPFDHAELINTLRELLGSESVLSGAEIPRRSHNDWSTLEPQAPIALVRPNTTEGVAMTMRLCARRRVPVVPQGGMTGLCGGARPVPGAVALSLERMIGVEDIDPPSATMRVRAGTPLQSVQQAADDAGFYFPLDLGARGSCTIGGNVSTNAGGNRVIRYGMAREMVLGIEAVLPDGTVLTSLNTMIKNNAGYELKQLFIGSEGTLGIITRLVLRLYPKPACTMAAVCALASYDHVVTMLGNARRALGPLLSAFEVMWPDYWQVVTKMPSVRVPITSAGHGAYVLIEAQGTDEAVEAPRFQQWLEQQAEDGILADAAVARSISDVMAFWGVRDSVSEFAQVLGPFESFDIGLPIARMDVYVQTCKRALEERVPGVVSVFYGHIGDSNLHIDVFLPEFMVHEMSNAKGVIYGLVSQFGGTVSAEHGIGLTKKPWLGHVRSEVEIALMRTLKGALDPRNLLNPGKVI